MANDLTVNPIRVDTVMASAAAPGQPMSVKLVYWFNPSASGDAFSIHDGSSGVPVQLEGRAEAANGSQAFYFEPTQIWRDFQVSVIGSGVLYIYF